MKRTTTNRPPDIEPYVNNRYEKVPVHQFGTDGRYIATFESQMEASRKTGVMQVLISSCVNGNKKSAGGFQWRRAK